MTDTHGRAPHRVAGSRRRTWSRPAAALVLAAATFGSVTSLMTAPPAAAATVPTSVVTASSQSPNDQNTSVTFTTTVTGSSATPTGSVKFVAKVGTTSTTICAVAPLSATSPTTASATCDYDPEVSGTLGQTATISATYSGDGTYTARAAAAIVQVENGSTPLTSFALATSASPVASGKAVKLTATLQGGAGVPSGTVTFVDGEGNACAPAKLGSTGIATCSYTPAWAGPHTIVANYSGNATYAAATAPTPLQQLVAGTTPVTSVVTTSTGNPNPHGTSATLTTAVTGSATTPTGTVTFTAKVGTATTTVCAAVPVTPASDTVSTASCEYDPTLPGDAGQLALITGSYSGDATYAMKAAAAFKQTEAGANSLTSLDLAASTNPVAAAHAVKLTATLHGAAGAPAGTVAFIDGEGVVCPAAKVSSTTGTATCSYSPVGSGSHPISAVSSGDLIYAGQSAPSPLDLRVNGTIAPTSVVTASASPNPNPQNTPVTLTTRVTGSADAPTGTITFTAKVGTTTTTICSKVPISPVDDSSSAASCLYNPSLAGAAGQTASVSATYSGDATYTSKAAAAYRQVEAGSNSLSSFTISSSANPAASGKSVKLTAALAGSAGTPTGSVTFSDGGIGKCTVKLGSAGTTSCTYIPSGNGPHTITATYGGDVDYAAMDAPSAFTEFVGNAGAAVPGAPRNVIAIAADGSASVSFTAPADIGAPPVTSYTVTASDWTTRENGGQTATGSGSPIVVTGLTNGDQYTFSVTAANVNGTGASSGSTDPVVPTAAIVPGAPSIDMATALDHSAIIALSPPAPNGGPDVQSFTVTATDATDPARGGQTTSGTADQIAIYGLTNGDHYTFTVAATNIIGTGPSSDPSAVVIPSEDHLRTIAVGQDPDGVSSDGTTVWVANAGNGQSDGTVSAIDPSDNEVVATIEVGVSPHGISSDGAHVWVANTGDDTVTEIDPTTDPASVVRVISGVGDSPTGIASDGTNVWVAVEGGVTEIDAASGAVLHTITGLDTPVAVALHGSSVWLANAAAATVTEIDATTATVVGNFPVGSGPVGVCTQGSHVWVVNDGDGSVSELDASNGSALRVISGVIFPDAIACAGTHVWLANDGNGTVSEINGSSGSIITTFSVGNNPDAIAADASAVWVANANDGTVSQLVDGPPGPATVGEAIVTGNTSAQVSFTPPQDNGTGVVSSYTVTATDVTNPAGGGQTGSGPDSPVDVGGLVTGDTYTFTVTSANAAGSGPASAASNPVTPSGQYVQTIGVGQGPGAVAADGSHVWIANTDDNVGNDAHGNPLGSVTELGADGSFVRTIPVDFLPDAVASDGTDVWVASEGFRLSPISHVTRNVVTEIDAATGTVLQTVTVGGTNAQLTGIALDAHHVWVADLAEDTVIELDAADGSVVATIPVGDAPSGVASDGTHVWVTDSGDGTVTELDATTGDVVATLDGFDGPWAVSADGTHVWVADAGLEGPGQPGGGDTLTELDASSGAVVRTISVGADPEGVSAGGAYVWVANAGDDTVSQILASTGAVVRSIRTGSNPSAISSDGTHPWVTNRGGNSVLELGIEP